MTFYTQFGTVNSILDEALPALLSLYQKELEKVLDKIAAADDFYGPRMIKLAELEHNLGDKYQ